MFIVLKIKNVSEISYLAVILSNILKMDVLYFAHRRFLSSQEKSAFFKENLLNSLSLKKLGVFLLAAFTSQIWKPFKFLRGWILNIVFCLNMIVSIIFCWWGELIDSSNGEDCGICFSWHWQLTRGGIMNSF